MLKAEPKRPVNLSEPVLGQSEKDALCAVIDSGWLSMGDRVAEFEKAFARMHGAEDAVAVNSCTAGLHIVLRALGIGQNDEVLVPSLTFVATVNAVLYVGAKPVFIDIIDLNHPHLSLEHAKTKLTSRSRAVMVMHYGGYLVDLAAWRSFCTTHGLLMIEDAAHAPAVGSVGLLSDAAAFSFFSNKNMSTAEGGMVLARDSEVLERARRLRAHGMTTDTLNRHRGHSFSYDVTMLGYNYRMDELRAAIGLIQLSRLQAWNQKRRELSTMYRQLLSREVPDVMVPFCLSHETAAHLMPVLLPKNIDRLKVMAHLREHRIQSSIHYPPAHLFSFYLEQFPNIKLSTTEEFGERELSLPLHPSMDQNDVIRVVETLRQALTQGRL
jgi:dTDP-4-amino-4,6-dideoxygalactose transaminase